MKNQISTKINYYDNANKEFENAITLMQYHADLLWNQFNAFLLSETVLIGFIGAVLSKESQFPQKNPIAFGGAILGLIICIPWFATFKYNYTYHLLRVFQAKRAESKMNSELFFEGEKISNGNEVTIQNQKIQMKCISLILKPRHAFPMLILFFLISFILIIVFSYPF
jgi:hypothetical protein